VDGFLGGVHGFYVAVPAGFGFLAAFFEADVVGEGDVASGDFLGGERVVLPSLAFGGHFGGVVTLAVLD